MARLSVNQMIDNYRIISLIKENSYCETYKVADDTGTNLFLKLYIEKDTPQELFHEGVVCEIRFMKRIDNENLIHYIADGRTQVNGEFCQWLVTEYFNGELLSERIYREKKLAPEAAESIFRGVINGLSHLHMTGIQHNDITPNNIMITKETVPTAKIIDMGHLSYQVMGKPFFETSDLNPLYSANCTFSGMFDTTCDLFSAVAVLYAMLFGKAPWQVDLDDKMTRKEKADKVRAARKNPLELSSDSAIPVNLLKIIEKGLVGINGTKYSDVKEIINDFGDQSQQSPEAGRGSFTQAFKKDDAGSRTETKTEEEGEGFIFKKGGGNGFKDIAGMDELKDMLRQKVIFVIQNKEIAEKYRLTPPNGMLLYGPPGCGKTFFAEKFAEETNFNFMLIKASDLASIYVHGSQEKIAKLFNTAEQKAPVVLCFDEFDALVPNRQSTDNQSFSGEVNEFLSQLNNCSHRGIFVVATSNRPDKIDPAVLRTGRIDKQIYVPLPDKTARKEMFILHLKNRPCDEIDYDRLADLSEGYVSSDISYVVNDASMTAAFQNKNITQECLENTINSVKPSVRKEVLAEYEQLREQMEGLERSNSNRRKIGFK